MTAVRAIAVALLVAWVAMSRGGLAGRMSGGRAAPTAWSDGYGFLSALGPSDFVDDPLALWLRTDSIDSPPREFLWRDRSPENNHFSAARDAPRRAPRAGALLDGKRGARFDAVFKQVLRCGAFTGIGKGDKPVMLAIASVNSDHPTGSPTLLYLGGRYSLLQLTYQVFNVTVGSVTGLVANCRLGSSGTAVNAGASAVGGYANGTPRLIMAVSSNASDRSEVWTENTLRGTAGTSAAGGLFATPTHAVIGSGDEGSGATRWMDGDIWELMLFRSLQGASLTTLLDEYVSRLWPTIYAGLA